MLILLPPSEGKTAPATGAPLDLDALAHPELTAVRERVLAALVKLSAGREARALAALDLSPRQAGELALNAALLSAPAAPAAEVYTGVLYERLRLPELPAAARERVLIASAIWGVVRPDDRIPAYRLSMAARLPRLGGLAARWRPVLRAALPDGGLVVDLRSGPYAAAWTPRAAEVVAVRAFAESAGRRRAGRGDRGGVGREVELTAGRDGVSVDVVQRDPLQVRGGTG